MVFEGKDEHRTSNIKRRMGKDEEKMTVEHENG